MAKKRQNPADKHAEAADENIDFETALADIEQIVAHLESGELGLSESLDKYEMGVRQLKRCHALLDAAEQRVSLLSGFDADGNAVTEPIEASVGRRKSKGSHDSGRRSRQNDETSGVDDSLGLF